MIKSIFSIIKLKKKHDIKTIYFNKRDINAHIGEMH